MERYYQINYMEFHSKFYLSQTRNQKPGNLSQISGKLEELQLPSATFNRFNVLRV